MLRIRLLLRRLTGVALASMLGLSLAPTLSHVLAAWQGRASSLAQICTPRGATFVNVDVLPGDALAPLNGMQAAEHCPFCSKGESTTCLPTVLAGATTFGPRGAMALLLSPPALGSLAVRWAAQPRAPPFDT